MKNYIVRIYRHEKDNPKKLVGLVEEPEVEGRKAFTNLDELWGILNPVKAAGVTRGNKEKQEANGCPSKTHVVGDRSRRGGVSPGDQVKDKKAADY